MKSLKTIYMDLDGTILDVSERLYSIHKDLLSSIGLRRPLSRGEYLHLKRSGVPEREIMQNFLEGEKLENYLHERMQSIESEEYLKFDCLFPKAHQVLNDLKKRHILVLITNRKMKRNALVQLQRLEIKYLFDEIIITEQKRGNGKKELIEKNQYFSQTSSIIIGDTEEDLHAGKKLGLKTIAVASGMRTKQFLQKWNPDFLLDDITEIFTVPLFVETE